MATPTITDPQGIDDPIQRLQNYFTSKLWTGKIPDDSRAISYSSYGKACIINGKPYYYVSAIDYKELLMNDKIDGHSFFVVNNSVEFNDYMHQSDVDLYFFVDLKKLSAVTTRAEQEVIKDVMEILRLEPNGFKLKSTTMGEDALKDFSDEYMQTMQPFFVFKFSLELIYKFNFC